MLTGALILTACGGGERPEEDVNKVELSEEDKALESLAINRGMLYTEAKSIIEKMDTKHLISTEEKTGEKFWISIQKKNLQSI